MDLPMDMKKQLMQMAGITDVNEFDKMASTFAEKSAQKNLATKETGQVENKKRKSPFQGMIDEEKSFNGCNPSY